MHLGGRGGSWLDENNLVTACLALQQRQGRPALGSGWLIDWLHTFQPDAPLRRLIIDAIRELSGCQPDQDADRRPQLLTQFERLRDLYMMGEFTKTEYVMRRQALEEELERTKSPADPDLDRA